MSHSNRRDQSGLPKVVASSMATDGIRIELSSGHWRTFALFTSNTKAQSEAYQAFAELIKGVGLVQITDTNQMHGRLYHGPLIGWTNPKGYVLGIGGNKLF